MISPAEELAGRRSLRREVTLDPGHGEVVSAWLHVVEPRGLRGVRRRGAGWSGRAEPGLEQLRVAASLPQLRRRRPCCSATSVLGFSLGNGWYRGRLSWNGHRDFYGDRLGLIAQLEVVFADGHRQVVVTDESWSAGPSEVVADDLYDGQTIDARLRDDSWLRPGPAPVGWVGVEAVPFDVQRLAPYVGPPVVRHESRRPVEIWTSPSGRTLVDFGQNLVGWLRFTVRGEAGHEITLRHAEVLEDGELGVRPAADRRGHRPARAQRWRRLLRADQDVPRVPLRGGQRLAGHPDRRLPRGRGRALRPAPDRPLLVLRRPAQPAARQHGLGPARQLPGRAQRLSATRRAARVDRRHRGVRALRGLPLRRRRLPPRLAGRPRTRAARPRTGWCRSSSRTR